MNWVEETPDNWEDELTIIIDIRAEQFSNGLVLNKSFISGATDEIVAKFRRHLGIIEGLRIAKKMVEWDDYLPGYIEERIREEEQEIIKIWQSF